MAIFEDGSYSSAPGIALIAKVLAGRCQMHYTRAAVGKGEIPEGESPKTMREPAEYVMDAKISAITNPVDGECQVTVQINSSDVEQGFYATGILLYAADPDEGEVPYTYLVLENGPEWIRPASSAVGKLATFDLIAAVGEVDRVTATIDPNSIVTRSVVEQLIAGATVKREITIPTTGWDVGAEESAEGEMYLDIPQDDVTAEMTPIISILPTHTATAKECGMSTAVRTLDGAVRLYAKKTPKAEMTATLTLLQASSGPAGSGGSSGAGGGDDVLPTATGTQQMRIEGDVEIKTYGSINVPGVSAFELSLVRTLAQNAKDAADAAQEAITRLTSTINSTPSQSGSLTYTGNEQAPAWNNYDPNTLTIGGTTKATNAGTYMATFTPKDGFQWSDGTSNSRSATWKINRATVSTPAQSGSLTYTGSSQSPKWTGYDTEKLTLGGTTSSTNAGTYNATFTPKANYQFSDGVTGAKTITWKINKAAGSLTVNKTSLTLSGGTTTGTVTATRTGDGAISATSNRASVATVSVSGTTITVTAKGSGTATITVSCAAGTNHTAPDSKTVSVTVEMVSPTLADNTPATIKAAAQSGQAANLWSVGDKVPILVNGLVGSLVINDTYYAIILGFNHNSSVEGGNSIHFQFGKNTSGTDIAFVDAGYDTSFISTNINPRFIMNTNSSNSGGWENSYMRKTICAEFLAALPTDWQNVIVSCVKYSDNTGGGNDTASYVTATQDKIWLLGEFEVFGTSSGANSAEQNYQKQYDYYKNGNSKIKYKHNDNGSACNWWLRSVFAITPTHFRYVSTDGRSLNKYAQYSLGIAPGFKIS